MACSGDEFYTVEGEECSALEPVGELLVVWRDACGLVVPTAVQCQCDGHSVSFLLHCGYTFIETVHATYI